MYMPMISNNSNHLRWPKVVSRDLIDHTHQLNNRIYVVTGLILDQTVLTQPLGIENLNHRNIQYNNLTLDTIKMKLIITWPISTNNTKIL